MGDNPEELFKLALGYLYGLGQEKDLARGMEYLEAAAAQGHEGARSRLPKN